MICGFYTFIKTNHDETRDKTHVWNLWKEKFLKQKGSWKTSQHFFSDLGFEFGTTFWEINLLLTDDLCLLRYNVYLAENKNAPNFKLWSQNNFEDKKMDYFKDECQKVAKITFQLVKTII